MAELVPILTPSPPTATTAAVVVTVVTNVVRLPVTVPTSWVDFSGQAGRTGVLEGR